MSEPTSTSSATVDGSGAAAQVGGTALGQGAVKLEGDNAGIINTGRGIFNLILDAGSLDDHALARLVAQQSAALRQDQAPDPLKLPLLCDRDEQHVVVKTAVTSLLSSEQRRPLVLALFGRSNEEHHAFVERLESFSIPQLLKGTTLVSTDRFIAIYEQVPFDSDQESFNDRLRSQIVDRLPFTPSVPIADDETLLRELRAAKRPTLVVTLSWHITELGNQAAQALQRLFNYWAQFPSAGSKMLIACIVSVKYDCSPAAARSGWRKWFGGGAVPEADGKAAALKAVVDQSAADFARDSRVIWRSPPELPLVKIGDLLRWRDAALGMGAGHIAIQELTQDLTHEPRPMEWVLHGPNGLLTTTKPRLP
ncbi:MAG: hypothetical protein JF607_05015 [Burkholderiales bacterium]|jgi:hypothetical protein|nr:hypothetical protein [Burkholderiales bacterium]